VPALRIAAVGDIMLGDQELRAGSGVASVIERKGAGYIFERVAPILKTGDVVFGNLESVLSDVNIDRGKLPSVSFRGTPAGAGVLRKAGFNALAVANNHIWGHGEEAFVDTVRRLQEEEIGVVGLADPGGGCRPLVMERDSRKVGFLGYCRFGGNRRLGRLPFCGDPTDDQIISDIRSLKAGVDIVIVSMHWGHEYMPCPSSSQVGLAHRMVEAGAQVILGHHPHCLQGMESYEGGLICYSLGNFVFDAWQNLLRSTVILMLEFEEGTELKYSLIPVYSNRSFQPSPMVGRRMGRRILDRVRELSGRIPAPAASDDKSYLDCADKRRRRMGMIARWHFILNLWRFSPRHILQVFRRFRERRYCSYKSVQNSIDLSLRGPRAKRRGRSNPNR